VGEVDRDEQQATQVATEIGIGRNRAANSFSELSQIQFQLLKFREHFSE
jgi:hypothetical protein